MKPYDYKPFLKKRVPIAQWLPRYKISTFVHDFLAGFTVSLTEIPQAIAYASVAGLPPEQGLYSCIAGGIVYAIFGTCKDVNVGPASMVGLVVYAIVAKFGSRVAILMSFLSGMIIVILGLFNLGVLIEFFSYPVVAGFTCAASIQIASVQVKNFFGIGGNGDSFVEVWYQFFHRLHEISKWDTIMGLVCLLLLIAMREINRLGSSKFFFVVSLTRNAIIIMIATALGYGLGTDAPFGLIGKIEGGFPKLEPPPFSIETNGTVYTFSEVISEIGFFPIIALPLIVVLESVTVAKTFANGKPLDATQEILALGISNVFNSFLNSMPISGVFSRSAISQASGVKTPLGGVFTSLIIILAVAFLTPVFYYIPKAAVAAVIICAMIYLFDHDVFVILWKSRKLDLVPFLTTFLCCLFLSLEYGILIGIGVNLLFVLYASARPKFDVTEEKISNHHGDIFVITPKDNLYFPAAEYLRDTVLQCEGENVTVVINGKNLRNMDVTVAKSMAVFAEEMEEKGRIVAFVDFKPSLVEICSKVDKNLGKFFETGDLDEIIAATPFENSTVE